MISAKAEHPNCAYKWLDWIVSPKVNAQVAEWFGEAPSNAESCALTADKNHCTVFHAADEPYWKKVHFWNTPIPSNITLDLPLAAALGTVPVAIIVVYLLAMRRTGALQSL